MTAVPNEDVARATEVAEQAFYCALADHFEKLLGNRPSGDLDPLTVDRFSGACVDVARAWIAANVPSFTAEHALEILRGSTGPLSLEDTGGGIQAARVDYGPCGHVWVTDDYAMSGEERWTVGYYWRCGDSEAEPVYRYPSTPEELRETVEALAEVHRETARVADLLEILEREPGAAVMLSMREGGIVSGTLTGDVDDPTVVRVNVRREPRPTDPPMAPAITEIVEERSYAITEIRAVHALEGGRS
jgi:hypothetical protein